MVASKWKSTVLSRHQRLFRLPFSLALLWALLGLGGCTVGGQLNSQTNSQVNSRAVDQPADQASHQSTNLLAVSPTQHSSEGNAEILQAISATQVVYLAENHSNVADHAAQLEIVQALAERGEIAIALEMFQRPFQPQLDAYLAGTLTEEALIAESEYETRWGFDWEFYAPIVRYAKANQVPLIALNTPAEITRKVAVEGLASLAGDDLTYIPPVADIDTGNEDYRAWMREVFSAHGGAGNSKDFENFFAAQVLWDETMAERVAMQQKAEPERQVIVLAGEGHIVYGYGIPSRVARRIPEITQASVQLLGADEEIKTNRADFFWVTTDRTAE